MRAPTCRTCKYWRKAVRAKWQDFSDAGRTVQVEHAQCRRHAPRSRAEYRSEFASAVWPETNATDWCGEHASPEALPSTKGLAAASPFQTEEAKER